MPLFTIEEVLELTGARVLLTGRNGLRRRIRRLCTDSREIRSGDLFIALKGERFDGHDFVDAALKKGAVGALIALSTGVESRYQQAPRRTLPLLLGVPDPLVAFQQLAAHHRSRFRIPVVAVTGSNGKTTTKEMVAAILAERWRVLKTEGNLNNRIGVPQTLLRLNARHEAAVVEMGVDQKGQTARLAALARPTIGLITNIGPDHLEFFGSMDASAHAKGELLDFLPPEAAAVLNADDPYFDYLASRARCRVVSFGFSPGADVRASGLVPGRRGVAFTVTLPGRVRGVPAVLPAHGRHNVANALAACAVGYLCGLSGMMMARGLARFRPASMRTQVEMVAGIQIINDCYNANPASMKAAIDLLVELGAGKRTIAVLGDMLELGQASPSLHREVGAHLAQQGVSHLIACGPLSRDIAEGALAAGLASDRIRETLDARAAAECLTALLAPGDVVLIKASRGMRLERVLAALRGNEKQ